MQANHQRCMFLDVYALWHGVADFCEHIQTDLRIKAAYSKMAHDRKGASEALVALKELHDMAIKGSTGTKATMPKKAMMDAAAIPCRYAGTILDAIERLRLEHEAERAGIEALLILYDFYGAISHYIIGTYGNSEDAYDVFLSTVDVDTLLTSRDISHYLRKARSRFIATKNQAPAKEEAETKAPIMGRADADYLGVETHTPPRYLHCMQYRNHIFRHSEDGIAPNSISETFYTALVVFYKVPNNSYLRRKCWPPGEGVVKCKPGLLEDWSSVTRLERRRGLDLSIDEHFVRFNESPDGKSWQPDPSELGDRDWEILERVYIGV
uniref:Uncharacterized protein n=1 Tax=Candidatus Kentrum sp. TC TaxID=2126339 RepID=A0A451A9J9_9GAMM|nr:MAG: hypothetical protein BECKTC1821F_GA0114240_10793 [Candidatus Kentron sp. TC]